MMIKKITFLLLLKIFIFSFAFAQDPQFSQFYAAPLYTNPALAGSEGYARAILNYRNQWPNLDVSFITYSGSFDYYFEKIRSGIGVIYTQDQATGAGLRSQNIGLQYAYDLQLNNQFNLKAGAEISYTARDFNFTDLTFGLQYNDTGFQGGPSGEPTPDTGLRYFGVASGLFLYSERHWLGLSVHNMTRPNQAFIGDDIARLPVRYTLQAGTKFPLNRFENWRDRLKEDYKERSISPTLLYKHQGSFDQLDIGVYITYEPIIFGLWYRGIPIKNYDIGISNNEALIGLLGFMIGELSIGYSYDFTISALGPNSGGANELSLRYVYIPKSKFGVKKKRAKTSFPCPGF